MLSEDMDVSDRPPGRDPKSKRKERKEQRLNKNVKKDDSMLSLDADEFGRHPKCHPKGPSHRKYQRQRMSQRKLNKKLKKVDLTPSIDSYEADRSPHQPENDQSNSKKRKHSEIGNESDNEMGDISDSDADDEIEVALQPAHHLFEDVEPWTTPPNKKTRYREAKTRRVHEVRSISYPTMPVKLTVFFHDHHARVLPPVRQDGTPLNELTDIETIRAKVEKVYAQQFRKTNYDRAVPKKAYHAFMAIKWSDYYVHGCRFSYTDKLCTRIQLPLMTTPEEFSAQAQVAATNVAKNHCYCGGMYCRYYNHPVELMAIYVLKEGQNERVEVRWSKEYADRKAAAQQDVLQRIKGDEDDEELAEAAKLKHGEQEDENEVGKNESSEEEDEKIVVPSRRRKAAPSAQMIDWEKEKESSIPAKPSRRHAATTTETGPGGMWDAQVEALRKKVNAGEEDPATIEAIRAALGMEPRRSRRAYGWK